MIPRYVRTLDDFHSCVGIPYAEGKRESKVLEFKRSLNTNPRKDKEIVRDIIQFANSDGGVLLIGVAEGDYEGARSRAVEVTGVSDPDRDVQWILQKLSRYCNDRTFLSELDILILNVNGGGDGERKVVAVNVKPRSNLVYIWDDPALECHVRTDEGKQAVRVEDIEARLMDTSRSKRIRLETLADQKSGSRWFLHGTLHEVQPHEEFESLTWKPVASGEYEFCLKGTYLRRDSEGKGTHQMLDSFNIPYSFIEEVWLDTMGRVHLLCRGWVEIEYNSSRCRWLPSKPASRRGAEELASRMNELQRSWPSKR